MPRSDGNVVLSKPREKEGECTTSLLLNLEFGLVLSPFILGITREQNSTDWSAIFGVLYSIFGLFFPSSPQRPPFHSKLLLLRAFMLRRFRDRVGPRGLSLREKKKVKIHPIKFPHTLQF